MGKKKSNAGDFLVDVMSSGGVSRWVGGRKLRDGIFNQEANKSIEVVRRNLVGVSSALELPPSSTSLPTLLCEKNHRFVNLRCLKF